MKNIMEKWLLHNSTAEKNFELNQQIRELIQKFAKCNITDIISVED